MTDLIVSPCNANEMEEVVRLLDQEFIYSRSRDISLARRFPNVFEHGGGSIVFVARSAGTIAGTIAVRRFTWHCQDREWQGAMIGSVFTKPQMRHQGIAARIMGEVKSYLSAERVDFGVLWTTIPELYAKSGWIPADTAVFGTAQGRPSHKSAGSIVNRRPLADVDTDALDRFRRQSCLDYVMRRKVDYQAIPLPASRVDVLLLEHDGGLQGYCLTGVAGSTAYVYEIVGDQQGFHLLWKSLVNDFDAIYINAHPSTQAHGWLSAAAAVSWCAQKLAMWLPVSKEAAEVDFNRWYVPYFDRM